MGVIINDRLWMMNRNSSDGDDISPAVASAEVNGGTKKKKEPLEAIVEEGRYKVVWSAVLLVSMLMNYLNVAANFPTLTMDVMQRVVDLLRVSHVMLLLPDDILGVMLTFCISPLLSVVQCENDSTSFRSWSHPCSCQVKKHNGQALG